MIQVLEEHSVRFMAHQNPKRSSWIFCSSCCLCLIRRHLFFILAKHAQQRSKQPALLCLVAAPLVVHLHSFWEVGSCIHCTLHSASSRDHPHHDLCIVRHWRCFDALLVLPVASTHGWQRCASHCYELPHHALSHLWSHGRIFQIAQFHGETVYSRHWSSLYHSSKSTMRNTSLVTVLSFGLLFLLTVNSESLTSCALSSNLSVCLFLCRFSSSA